MAKIFSDYFCTVGKNVADKILKNTTIKILRKFLVNEFHLLYFLHQ